MMAAAFHVLGWLCLANAAVVVARLLATLPASQSPAAGRNGRRPTSAVSGERIGPIQRPAPPTLSYPCPVDNHERHHIVTLQAKAISQ